MEKDPASRSSRSSNLDDDKEMEEEVRASLPHPPEEEERTKLEPEPTSDMPLLSLSSSPPPPAQSQPPKQPIGGRVRLVILCLVHGIQTIAMTFVKAHFQAARLFFGWIGSCMTYSNIFKAFLIVSLLNLCSFLFSGDKNSNNVWSNVLSSMGTSDTPPPIQHFQPIQHFKFEPVGYTYASSMFLPKIHNVANSKNQTNTTSNTTTTATTTTTTTTTTSTPPPPTWSRGYFHQDIIAHRTALGNTPFFVERPSPNASRTTTNSTRSRNETETFSSNETAPVCHESISDNGTDSNASSSCNSSNATSHAATTTTTTTSDTVNTNETALNLSDKNPIKELNDTLLRSDAIVSETLANDSAASQSSTATTTSRHLQPESTSQTPTTTTTTSSTHRPWLGTVIVVELKLGPTPTNSQISFVRDMVTYLVGAIRDRAPDDVRHFEVVVLLESNGGGLDVYGLLADQFRRLRTEPGVILTICCDQRALSGGYMLAAMATPGQLLAAPFALIGSIGTVLSEHVNLHAVLERFGIQSYHFKSGKHKNLLTVLSPMTPEDVEYIQQEMDAAHAAFCQHVQQWRSVRAMTEHWDQVTSGSHWLASTALLLGLVDQIMTSDEYIDRLIRKGFRVNKLRPANPPSNSFWNALWTSMGSDDSSTTDTLYSSSSSNDSNNHMVMTGFKILIEQLTRASWLVQQYYYNLVVQSMNNVPIKALSYRQSPRVEHTASTASASTTTQLHYYHDV